MLREKYLLSHPSDEERYGREIEVSIGWDNEFTTKPSAAAWASMTAAIRRRSSRLGNGRRLVDDFLQRREARRRQSHGALAMDLGFDGLYDDPVVD
jgi:hypothetical protein